MEHRASLCGKKTKRRNATGANQQRQLAISNDLEQLIWTAADIEERAEI